MIKNLISIIYLYSVFFAFGTLSAATANSNECTAANVSGTYISDVFTTKSPDSSVDDMRSQLLVLNADGTAITYQSNSVSTSNANGFELTPALGIWKCINQDTVHVLAFDYLVFASNHQSLDMKELSLWGDPTPDGTSVPGEYDRIAMEIKMSNLQNGQFQKGVSDQRLTGIANTGDPLNPTATPTVKIDRKGIKFNRITYNSAYFSDFPLK